MKVFAPTSAMNVVAPRFGAKPHYDHQTLAQVISEVLQGLGPRRENLQYALPAQHRRLHLQSLDTFAFMLSIRFL